MKRYGIWAVALSILVTGSAIAAGTYTVGREVQLLARGTPLTDAPVAGEYIKLANVKKVRLTICTCTSSACTTRGGNLTGGNMQCWYRPPGAGAGGLAFGWVINSDLNLTVGSVGQACRTWPDMESPGANTGGDMFCAASSVTAASGTHLDVILEGINNG